MLQRLGFVRHEWRKKIAEWKFLACREIRLSSNTSGRAWRRGRKSRNMQREMRKGSGHPFEAAEKKRLIKWLFAHNTAFETVFQ
jgi:hypothetical protein